MSDIFSVFSGVGGAKAKKKTTCPGKSKADGRGGWVERRGMVVRVSPASVLFFDDASSTEMFIPVSQVKDWWFTSSGAKRGLSVPDLELDDEVTLVVPRWLLKNEGVL